MIASVHVVDGGRLRTIRALARRPKPGAVPGLRAAEVALLVPLLSGLPPIRRAGLIAFWDDETAVDRFVATDPIGRRFSGGLHARLRPLRAHGSWPGLPEDLPKKRSVPHDGPVVVLTLGRLRLSQATRFRRASRPAEKAALAHEGMIWASASTRPPFMATISIWRSDNEAAEYAYGHGQSAHHDAIDAQHRKDFHRQSAFIRFAPTRLEGTLVGPNPFAASTVAF